MAGRPLTVPEALAASVMTLLSIAIAAAYLWARVARIAPFAILGLVVASAAVIAIALCRRATRDAVALVAALAVLAAMTGWLLWLARPGLLPPGGGPDLTHHLLLVDYIERHWQLPDASLVAAMGEMAHYTPGLHLLAALAGAWTRTDGLHAIYPLVAVAVALKAVFVVLIALRLFADSPARVPLAFTTVLLLLLPQAYFLGSFFHDSFLAQAVAELFAVAMWWSLVVWDGEPSPMTLALFAVAGVGAFLTWPLWIGPPAVALAAAILTRDDLVLRERLTHLALAGAPIAVVALAHAAGRVGWLGMAGTTGAVVQPSIAVLTWPFVILATAGVLIALPNRRARTTLLLTLSIAVQAATLYALARARGASTPYMALKMMYLLIYPLAVFGALAIAAVWERIEGRVIRGPDRLRQGYGGPPKRYATVEGPRYVREGQAIAWALLLLIAVTCRKPLTAMPRPQPVVSNDLYEAGRWARGQLEAACVDYLVPHADTAYWLHLAVLGNPRSSLRTANPNTFDPARTIARWIEPGGLPYAVAHLPTLPKEVLGDVDVLEVFGTAAVVTRRGPSFCPDAQRFASGGRLTP